MSSKIDHDGKIVVEPAYKRVVRDANACGLNVKEKQSAATKAGEVTDAMVKAARVWLTHLHMKRQVDVDNAVHNAIEAALEAALPPPAEPALAAAKPGSNPPAPSQNKPTPPPNPPHS